MAMSEESQWNEDLFGCTNDCGVCLYGFCCTPCLFGSNANKIDGSNCFLMCCAYGLLSGIYLCWLPHYFERQKLREKYRLPENPSCGDCPTTLCCGPCALCQEAREMKGRESEPNPSFRATTRPVSSQPKAEVNAAEPTVNLRV